MLCGGMYTYSLKSSQIDSAQTYDLEFCHESRIVIWVQLCCLQNNEISDLTCANVY